MIDFGEFKKFFLFNLIGGLVISSLVAVITIIIGEFNEITWRVLLTLLMVIIHSLVSLAFIWDDTKHDTFNRLTFFTNILFLIIVMSFVTSILGIWWILGKTLVWKLYQTFFIFGFAALHSDILSKTLHKETYLDRIVYFNYIFIAIVVVMFVPIIYIENSFKVLGEIYYRFLAAAGIIDGTLSILTIIFYKLYMHKHPQEKNALNWEEQGDLRIQKKGMSVWVWILIIYLLFQIAWIFFGYIF